ncbi:hypothetical protein AAVH_12723 [Aphelenchoides avenae]|nr:hypothetical protein AAVH_12723 [Aphelenchus avenae]
MPSAIFLTILTIICSQVLATRQLRHTDALGDTDIDVQAEVGSHQEDVDSLEGDHVQRLKRQIPTRLDDINIKINATDNSHRSGSGRGSDGGAHRDKPGAERLTPVRATDARRKPNTIGDGEEVETNRRLAPNSSGRRQNRY